MPPPKLIARIRKGKGGWRNLLFPSLPHSVHCVCALLVVVLLLLLFFPNSNFFFLNKKLIIIKLSIFSSRRGRRRLRTTKGISDERQRLIIKTILKGWPLLDFSFLSRTADGDVACTSFASFRSFVRSFLSALWSRINFI